MLRKNYTFLSTDTETKLNITTFEPECETNAVLIVAHGIGEHIGRYEELAEFLTSKGILVTGFDCIGHGKSVAKSGKARMYFGKEGSWDYLVKDMVVFTNEVKKNYPNIPCFMLGFSMGSFLVRSVLATRNVKIDGAILAGTGRISPVAAKLVKFVIAQEAKKVGGDDKVSEKINSLAFGNYNKYFKPCKTEFDWLCADEAAIQEYIDDPLTNKFITPGMFRELISAIAYTNTGNTIRLFDKQIPILFMSGEDDPVGKFKKGVFKVREAFNKYNAKTSLLMYPNSRHDVFHDTCKDMVKHDIYTWISSVM